MSMDTLPAELLIIIIKKLDLKSISNLYDTGNSHIQSVIHSRGIIKKCNFSMSTMATAKSLKLSFLTNVAPHLQELCLNYVSDLKRTSLLPLMKRFKNLTTLDVAFTRITILDMVDFYELCPTIKNVALDYQFHKAGALRSFPEELIEKCQNVFANFVNVHFVGSTHNLLYSELPKVILEKAKLNHLIYTVAKVDKMFTFHKYTESRPLYCSQFSLFFLHWRKMSPGDLCLECPNIVKELPFEYEFICVTGDLHCSGQFRNFFKDRFSLEMKNSQVIPRFRRPILSQTDLALLIWNKETTEFTPEFFNDVFDKVNLFFPSIRVLESKIPELPLDRKWVCIKHPLLLIPETNEANETAQNEPPAKKKRTAPPCITLDYDDLLKQMKSLELSIYFYDHIKKPVTLSFDCTYLRKLTYLNLAGSVRYSAEFFNLLFRCCVNMAILNIEAPSVSPCIAPVARSITLSRSIQSLRIVDKKVDFQLLFSSLSQCKTMINIEIQDLSSIENKLSSPDILFRQCSKLFNLSLHVNMSVTARTKMLQTMNEAKEKYELHHLHIELILPDKSDVKYTYDPYVLPFRLSQIKMIDPF